MLLLMIERGMPIDIVLTADTGMEFPEMYDHLAKLDEYLYRERGIHLTMLRHPKGFEYMMFEEEKQKISSIENRQKLGVPLYGNGWPGVRVRWCTGQLKTHLIAKEVNRLKGKYRALHYVGIAADEPKRIKNEQYPLVDWGITEAKALKICYDRGYDWGGLYEIYHRCSCWCCPFQRIDELRKLRHHHPELWQKLRDMDQRAIAQFGHNPLGQFKQNWTVRRGRSYRLKLNLYCHPNTPTTGVFFRICEVVALTRRSSTTASSVGSFTRTQSIIIAYLWATETTSLPMARCGGHFQTAPLPVKFPAAINGFPLPCLAVPVVKRSACLKRPLTHSLI